MQNKIETIEAATLKIVKVWKTKADNESPFADKLFSLNDFSQFKSKYIWNENDLLISTFFNFFIINKSLFSFLDSTTSQILISSSDFKITHQRAIQLLDIHYWL